MMVMDWVSLLWQPLSPGQALGVLGVCGKKGRGSFDSRCCCGTAAVATEDTLGPLCSKLYRVTCNPGQRNAAGRAGTDMLLLV
jgi:hypothetical protein